MNTISKIIIPLGLACSVAIGHAQSSFNLTDNDFDNIIGEAQNLNNLGYNANITTSQDVVGGMGASGNRRMANLIYRYEMPTVPSGETFSSGTFFFEVTGLNGTASSPGSLAVYLLDTNPVGTGTDYYRNNGDGGTFAGDPNGDNVLLGIFDFSSGVGEKSITLSGSALALLNELNANGASTIALRFNSETVNFASVDRWTVSSDPSTSGLNLVTVPEPAIGSLLLGTLSVIMLLGRRRH
jgi:hypothetical protein